MAMEGTEAGNLYNERLINYLRRLFSMKISNSNFNFFDKLKYYLN